jgi:AcrR family transcriptional regulator
MKRRVRKPGAERRKEIARAVLRIIGERGLTSLTTTTLAEEVGVTSGALFRHFASRDEMLEEAVQYALAKIEATFPDESLPPVERLLELARNRVHLLGSDPGIAWLLRSEQAYLTLPARAVEPLRDLVKRSTRFLLDALREGASQGSIRSDIEPEVLLVPVVGTIHALIGLAGIHKPTTRGRQVSSARVLSGLERLLAPPERGHGHRPRDNTEFKESSPKV